MNLLTIKTGLHLKSFSYISELITDCLFKTLSAIFLFPRIEVAIKEGSSSNAKDEMLEEAKAMIRVAKHDHIVNFLGISMDGEKVYVLLEFCSFGSIDSFLEKNSENFRMKMECGNYKEVVSWFVQVADAMDFLVKNNIIHVSTTLQRIELEIRTILH